MTQLERDELRRVRKTFELAGAFVYRTSQHRKPMHSAPEPGIPDLIVLMPAGRGAVFFEGKVAGNRLRPDQELFERRATRAGVPYVVGGNDEAVAYLKKRRA